MSGFEVLVELVPRGRYPDMAVIVLTRLILHPMARLALTNGAQAFLAKPRSSCDDLQKAIEKAISAVGPSKARG
jgi:FixJ family two-component response regulator